MDLTKSFNKVLSILFSMYISVHVSYGYYDTKIDKEFQSLSRFYETEDFKAGLFYVNQIDKFIEKKAGVESPEYLTLLSYQALFYNKLNKKDAFTVSLKTYKSVLSKIKSETSIALLYPSYLNLSILFNQTGNYILEDSLFTLTNKDFSGLLPYERLQLKYYQLQRRVRSGYFNQVLEEVDHSIDKISLIIKKDSFRIDEKYTMYRTTHHREAEDRYVLLGKYILFKTNTLLQNETSTTAFEYLTGKESSLLPHVKKRKDFTSLYYYTKGKVLMKLDQYDKAERQFKKASLLGRSFYLEHAGVLAKIQYELIKTLIARGKLEEADYYNNLVDVRVIGYFGKKSLSYLANNYQDIELLLGQGLFEEAENAIHAFTKSDILPDLHLYREIALLDLYQVYIKEHEFVKADSTLQQLTNLEKQLYGKNAPKLRQTQVIWALFNMYYSDDYQKSIDIFDQVPEKELLQNISCVHPIYIKYIITKANLALYLQDFEEAKSTFANALHQVKDKYGDNTNEEAILGTEYGVILTEVGEFKKADNILDKSISIFETHQYDQYIPDHIKALKVKAKLSLEKGEFEYVETLFEKTNALIDESNTLIGEDQISMEEIGLMYVYTGKFQKASKYLLKALHDRERTLGKQHKSLTEILNYLGELNIALGNYDDADTYLSRSAKIARNVYGENSLVYARHLVYVKNLHEVLGNRKDASKSIQKAIEIYSSALGENNIKVGILMHEYAVNEMEVYFGTKQEQKVKKKLLNLIERSFAIIDEKLGAETPAKANAYENAAKFNLINQELTKAITWLEKAREIWENKLGRQNLHLARIQNLYGDIYHLLNKPSQALNSYEIAKTIHRKLLGTNHPQFISSLGRCAKMHYVLNQKVEAVKSIEECINKSLIYINDVFPLLSERGKAMFWDEISEDFEFYKSMAFKYHQQYPEMIGKVYDIEIKTRSILLNSSRKIKEKIFSSGDEQLIQLYNDLLANREILARAYSMTSNQRKENGITLHELEGEKEQLEKQLSELSDAFEVEDKSIKNYDWKALVKVLKENEAVIEIVPYRHFTNKFTDSIFYAVIKVDHNTKKSPEFIIIKDGVTLQGKGLKYYRNCMKFGLRDKKSYRRFWKPIENIISDDNKVIYVVNDGVYNQINLETLSKEKNKYLIEEYDFINIGTSRDVFAIDANRKKVEKELTQKNITLVGNPQYYIEAGTHEWEQLQGAEKEVTKIDSMVSQKGWKSKLYIQESATEASLKSIEESHVIHISTHGFFLEDNHKHSVTGDYVVNNSLMRSGLLLKDGGEVLENNEVNYLNRKDGVLTAYEAMNLSLEGTELVILSACETGRGDTKVGEGVYGLQRSFFSAGAKSVIMSLFKVSDEITQKLMMEFYSNWLRTGDKRQSFIDAKKKIMQEENNPIFWGAFVMIGK